MAERLGLRRLRAMRPSWLASRHTIGRATCVSSRTCSNAGWSAAPSGRRPCAGRAHRPHPRCDRRQRGARRPPARPLARSTLRGRDRAPPPRRPPRARPDPQSRDVVKKKSKLFTNYLTVSEHPLAG
jgi:hypothetical protein